MGSLILRFTCRKAAAGIPKRNRCSGGGRRMMSTTTMEPSRISPWLMLPPAAPEDGGGYKFYSLASGKVVSLKKEAPSEEGQVKVVGSSHGWVASFNLDNQHMFLSNPITSRHMKLPDIHTLPQSLFTPGCRTIVDKIILSSAAEDECRAVMTFGVRGMALCHPAGESSWTHAGDGFYDDFVYSSRRKSLFCITENNDVECWDLAGGGLVWKEQLFDLDVVDQERSEAEAELLDEQYRLYRSLVFAEDSDQLFLVTRQLLECTGRDGSCAKTIHFGQDRGTHSCYPYKTFAFDVHEIDRERRQVRYMDGSLNGLAMFVGINHSLALPAVDFPELQPDSIYFTDDTRITPLDEFNDSYGGHDIGIFNYVDGSFSSVYYSCRASHITRILPAPLWFTPTPHPHPRY